MLISESVEAKLENKKRAAENAEILGKLNQILDRQEEEPRQSGPPMPVTFNDFDIMSGLPMSEWSQMDALEFRLREKRWFEKLVSLTTKSLTRKQYSH